MALSFIPKNPVKTKPPSGSGFLPFKPAQPESRSPQPSRPDQFSPSEAFVPSSDQVSAGQTSHHAQLSLDNLNQAQQIALGALPPAAAVALRQVWDAVEDRSSKEKVLTLLSEGTLAAQEDGRTVAESLANLSRTPRADGFDPSILTRQAVNLLAAPESSVYQGLNTYTCGAANMQFQLAEDRPARLSQMIDSLTSPTGTFTLPNGAVLSRPESVEVADKSGRDELNRLLQGTFMAYAGEGKYDPLSDTFSRPADNDEASRIRRSLGLERSTNQGLGIEKIAAASAILEGAPKSLVSHRSETHQEFRRLLTSLPEGQEMQVGVSWNAQDHMLVYLGGDQEKARYFNPQDAATGEMEMGAFLRKVQYGIFPSAMLEGAQLPEGQVKTFQPL